MLAISGPSVVIAWLKLRQRSLSPLLEASGWAVNSRVKINIPLGTSLTDRATLPPKARLLLKDPYEDRTADPRALFLSSSWWPRPSWRPDSTMPGPSRPSPCRR